MELSDIKIINNADFLRFLSWTFPVFEVIVTSKIDF